LLGEKVIELLKATPSNRHKDIQPFEEIIIIPTTTVWINNKIQLPYNFTIQLIVNPHDALPVKDSSTTYSFVYKDQIGTSFHPPSVSYPEFRGMDGGTVLLKEHHSALAKLREEKKEIETGLAVAAKGTRGNMLSPDGRYKAMGDVVLDMLLRITFDPNDNPFERCIYWRANQPDFITWIARTTNTNLLPRKFPFPMDLPIPFFEECGPKESQINTFIGKVTTELNKTLKDALARFSDLCTAFEGLNEDGYVYMMLSYKYADDPRYTKTKHSNGHANVLRVQKKGGKAYFTIIEPHGELSCRHEILYRAIKAISEGLSEKNAKCNLKLERTNEGACPIIQRRFPMCYMYSLYSSILETHNFPAIDENTSIPMKDKAAFKKDFVESLCLPSKKQKQELIRRGRAIGVKRLRPSTLTFMVKGQDIVKHIVTRSTCLIDMLYLMIAYHVEHPQEVKVPQDPSNTPPKNTKGISMCQGYMW
jgi:hypothetical protein